MEQTYEMNESSVKNCYDSRIQAAECESALKWQEFFLKLPVCIDIQYGDLLWVEPARVRAVIWVIEISIKPVLKLNT